MCLDGTIIYVALVLIKWISIVVPKWRVYANPVTIYIAIYHFDTLDQRDLATSVYFSYKHAYICIIPDRRDIYRYIPDHKIFYAKAALYIACTNSLSIMGFNYEVLAYFGGLLMLICSDKRNIIKTIGDHRKVFWVSI